MGVVTSDFLAAVYTNFRAVYQNTFEAAQNQEEWMPLVMEIPSTTLTETYEWLGTVPKMREWVDERKLASLGQETFSLTNKHYEATIEVDRDTFEDDRLGVILPRVRQLAMEAARYPRELAMNVIINGTTYTGYDGKALFANDHDGGDNLLAGAGVTVDNIKTDIKAVTAAMREFTDDHDRPLNIVPDTYVVPAELEYTFREVLRAGQIDGTDNVYKTDARLIVAPELTDANDWYAFSTTGAMKAIIYQVRKAPEFVELSSPKDYANFMRRQMLYGVDSRCAMGVGIWWYAAKVVNT